jgi:hypothetical protein
MNVMTLPRIRRSLGLVSLTLVVGGCGNSPVTVEVDTAGETPSVRTIESLYDIESTVTLEGPVQAVMTPLSGNSMLAIAAEDPEAEDQDGKLLFWAIESNTDALQSARRTRSIIPGTRLTVTAYLPKPEADVSVALTNAPRLPIDRVVHGVDAMLPDGTSVVLGELP